MSHQRTGGQLIRRSDGKIADGCGSGGPCSNQCVVEFESNFYDCSGWTTPAPLGSPFCDVPDVGWIEDPADCLRATRRVLTAVPKCCTNTANCATSAATVPDPPSVTPICVDGFNVDLCCQRYTASIVGDCYGGTYDLDYVGGGQWVAVDPVSFLGIVFLRCTGKLLPSGLPQWELRVDPRFIAACAGRDPAACVLRLESGQGCCYCPPTGTVYVQDPTLNEAPPPYDCGTISVTVTKSACS